MEERITLLQARDVVGKTWFKSSESAGYIMFESNLNMDYEYGTAGRKDKQEGIRIDAALRQAFPKHAVRYSVADEWVSVGIMTAPKD